MSDYTVIGDVGETLKQLLESEDLWRGISPIPEITFKSPKELKDDGESTNNKISVFLYQILENQHLRNEEMQRVDNRQFQLSPLALDLFYLITPYHDDKTLEKVILGKVMQIFYDNRVLTGTVLHEDIGVDEEIKVLFNAISLDDLTKIWSAFQEAAYRLSVSYLVSPVRIDSVKSTIVPRVVSKKSSHYIK